MPESNSILSEYVIMVRRAENTSWADSLLVNTNSTKTTFTVTKLHPFTVYSFKVMAIFASGDRVASDESYYMITLRETPSGSPTITMAHNISSNAIYLVRYKSNQNMKTQNKYFFNHQAWEPPHPLTINGEFLGYKLSYESRALGASARSGVSVNKQHLVIRNPTVREYILRDLVTYTQYTLSLQVRVG